MESIKIYGIIPVKSILSNFFIRNNLNGSAGVDQKEDRHGRCVKKRRDLLIHEINLSQTNKTSKFLLTKQEKISSVEKFKKPIKYLIDN